jgi:hypothetical protein
VVGEPCCNRYDSEANGRRQQDQTTQLLPNRNPHLDHPLLRTAKVFFISDERGLVPWRLGTQRLSVSRGARELSNVQDEAVEERGVSSVSHSFWQVSRRIWWCRCRCRMSGEAKGVMLGCVAGVVE